MYDVIIIGSGSAGLTAALYAVRREMKVLVLGEVLGGQLTLAGEIENYPGFKSIQAYQLIDNMFKQVKEAGVEIRDARVEKIIKEPSGHFSLKTKTETLEAKTVIVAMGLLPRKLNVEGEAEFSGKGVSYCANCDGPFFRDKRVMVVGGGNSALDAAEVLSKIASQVYLIHRSDQFKAFDSLVSQVKAKDNIEIITHAELKKIVGTDKVEKVLIEKNDTQGEMREIELEGVFIEIGRIASTELLAELVDRDASAQVLVNERMETKTPGLFVAGDVTSSEFKQLTIANGQATIAALSAYQYLQLAGDN